MNEDFERLLELSFAQAEKLAVALERNWTIHLVLAAAGLAIVFDVGNLPEFLVKHFVDQDTFERKPVALILLPIVLFYFMKFGHLLTSFFDARRLVVEAVEKYGDTPAEQALLSGLEETTSFFEVFFPGSDPYKNETLRFVALCIVSLVFSTEQATAIYLLIQTYNANYVSIVMTVSILVCFFLLYAAFFKSRAVAGTVGKKVAAISCILLIAGILLLFFLDPK
ncbi:hypothetical protein [Paraburkholderia pallida]|uniref:Uncharacterized protein n=1 Tax=Paraburkholderia pallida TaxID=2547399 RepID=A0A4P7DBV9_9BURK|nr:hypothetical protein [Paraburkholderia pallida]QBR04424.1 hypothetical protein E1956_45935 [Paraburkholderia pallida]